MEELNFIDRLKKVINEEVVVDSGDGYIGYCCNEKDYLILDSSRITTIRVIKHEKLPSISAIVEKEEQKRYKKEELNYFFESINEILETFRSSSIPYIHEFENRRKEVDLLHIQKYIDNKIEIVGLITNLDVCHNVILNLGFTATPEKVIVRSTYRLDRLDLIDSDNRENIISQAKSKDVKVIYSNDNCELLKREKVTLSKLPSITELLDTKRVESIFNSIK